jgi:hypothetical protein
MGMNKRIVPSSASLYPKNVFIVGILDAHEEKQNPETKKNTLRKKRCLSFRSMLPNSPTKVARLGERKRKD